MLMNSGGDCPLLSWTCHIDLYRPNTQVLRHTPRFFYSPPASVSRSVAPRHTPPTAIESQATNVPAEDSPSEDFCMKTVVIALDLEGTLISNAYH